jgi:hypothetical protein
MALPYPPEVETGELSSRPRQPRRPFDVGEHLAQAIVVQGAGLSLFGVALSPPEGQDAEQAAARFHAALLAHFNERRPDADSATWESFASQARAQLERLERADDEALRALSMSIDGL